MSSHRGESETVSGRLIAEFVDQVEQANADRSVPVVPIISQQPTSAKLFWLPVIQRFLQKQAPDAEEWLLPSPEGVSSNKLVVSRCLPAGLTREEIQGTAVMVEDDHCLVVIDETRQGDQSSRSTVLIPWDQVVDFRWVVGSVPSTANS